MPTSTPTFPAAASRPAVAAPAPLLTTEAELADPAAAAAIDAFWSREGRFDRFTGAGGVGIACAVFRQPDPAAERGAVVVVNGRTESLLKYPEVAYDLWRNGRSVYLYDHRGQGLSGREPAVAAPALRERGHVGRFEDYVDDLRTFVRERVVPGGHRRHHLLAHSMGAAVAALLLEADVPERSIFSAAVLGSPMLALGGAPGGLPLGPLACGLATALRSFGLARRPALPHGRYAAVPFEDNPYTRSALRFDRWRTTFDQAPETRLGAPTIGWLAESCRAMRQACVDADRIRVPVMLLVAGADRVVHPSGGLAFAAKLAEGAAQADPTHRPAHARIVIPDARHELLIEIDPARRAALGAALDFFDRAANADRSQ